MARILVIDDDVQILRMLRHILEDPEYEVVGAPNGRVAMRLQRENPVDLVITDIIMPEMEGIEVIIELRKQYPDVKIIAMSGGGRMEPEGYLYMAKRIGADRVFSKPFLPEELLEAVEDLLSD